jgi:hypothetical protein
MHLVAKFPGDEWRRKLGDASFTSSDSWARVAVLCFWSSNGGFPVFFCKNRSARAAAVKFMVEEEPGAGGSCSLLTDDGIVRTLDVKKLTDAWDSVHHIALAVLSSGSSALAAVLMGLFSGSLPVVFGVFVVLFVGVVLLFVYLR